MSAAPGRRTAPRQPGNHGARAVRLLSELRIGHIGSDGQADALRAACAVERLEPGDWRERLGERAPHLLLTEGLERLDPEWRAEIDALLSTCGRLGVPRMLWVSGDRLDPAYLELAERFDRAFATGAGQLLALPAAGFRDPSLLWAATPLPVDDRAAIETGARPDPILWVGGWREDWPPAWRARLTEVLRAAASKELRIVGVPDPEALPRPLREHVRPTPLNRAEALEGARLVVAADPAIAADDIVPAVLFDAIACGAAVISPAPVGSIWDFCRGGTLGAPPEELIPAVEDFESASAEIDRLLDDDLLREEVVHQCRRVVAYNHTYAHRAATLASAAGLRLIPDASTYPAHS